MELWIMSRILLFKLYAIKNKIICPFKHLNLSQIKFTNLERQICEFCLNYFEYGILDKECNFSICIECFKSKENKNEIIKENNFLIQNNTINYEDIVNRSINHFEENKINTIKEIQNKVNNLSISNLESENSLKKNKNKKKKINKAVCQVINNMDTFDRIIEESEDKRNKRELQEYLNNHREINNSFNQSNSSNNFKKKKKIENSEFKNDVYDTDDDYF